MAPSLSKLMQRNEVIAACGLGATLLLLGVAKISRESR